MRRSVRSKSIPARRSTLVAATVSMLVFAAMTARAQAQTAPPPAAADSSVDLQEVVVTGTLIHNIDAPIGSALVVVSPDDIKNSGLQTTADIIRSLPFVSGIGPGEALTNSSANLGTLNITHSQGIDIRGLGDQATLNLLDGRRVVPAGEGAQLFDPSVIPAIALQRIEVVPDGASAVYGTDAVAGVVNLILRKNFTGLEVEASDGFAKDFNNQMRFSVIGGHAWEGGSIMIAGEFFSHPGLMASDRPSLYNDNQTAFGGADLRSKVGAPGNITYQGTLYGLPAGSGVGLTPAAFLSKVNETSQWADKDSVPPVERHSAVLSFQQKLAASTTFWVEGYFSERYGTLLGGVPAQTGLSVPSTNPYYIAAAATPCSPGSASLCDSVNYAFTNELGPIRNKVGGSSYQLASGIDVDLPHDFKFNLYGTTNQDSETNWFDSFSSAGLAAALADSNPATALNVMGSGGAINPGTASAIMGFQNYTSHYLMNLLNAKVDGPVVDLPGGPLLVAVGTEWHKDKLHNLNYGNSTGDNTSEYAITVNNTASRSVSSGYVEAVVPFFGPKNASPGLQRLELDVAGRYDKYSDFGSATNPKFGMRWDPITDLTTHASFGKSFRAPTLCDASPYCTAGVITIPFPDLGWKANNPPSIFGPGVSLTAIEVGGLAGIKPETATTYSGGFDWHPQWIPTLKASVDFYSIDYKNIIDAPAAFNPAAGLDPSYASLVIRNPTLPQVLAVFNSSVAGSQAFPPQLVNLIVDGRRHNVGEARTNGLDFSLSKQWATPGVGTFLTAVNGTYVLKYDYALVPGAPLLDVLNTIQGSGNAYPLRFTARGQVGWHLGGISANAYVNYHNSYGNTSVRPTQEIASYTTVDLSVGYDTGDSLSSAWLQNTSISLTANNVFDHLPPFALVGTQLFDSTTGGPLGRLITVTLDKRF